MAHPKKLTFTQMFMIFIMSTGLLNHVTILPPLLGKGGRDSWLACILTAVLGLGWNLLLIYIANKMKGKPFRYWLRESVGSIAATFMMLVLSVYLFTHVCVTLIQLTAWTNNSYLPLTPAFVLAFVLMVPCFYNAYRGIHSIKRTVTLLLPFVILFGFLVGLANMPRKDFSLLKPFLEFGFSPVFQSMIYFASGNVEMLCFVFLQHRMESPPSWKGLSVLSLMLLWLTLGPLIGAITEFGPHHAANLRHPAFEEWRLLKIGDYIEHLDFLSIYQWITGSFIRISLLMYMIAEFWWLEREQNQTKRKWLLLVLSAIPFGIYKLSLTDMQLYELAVKWILPLSFYLMFACSLIFVVLARFQKGKEPVHHDTRPNDQLV